MNIDKHCTDLNFDRQMLVDWVEACASCRSVFKAFVYDTHFKKPNLVLRIVKRWMLDPNYRIRVLHRMMQLYFFKELQCSLSLEKLHNQLSAGEFGIAGRVFACYPKRVISRARVEWFAYLWKRIEWRMRKNFNTAISPLAMIAKGHLVGQIWDVGIAAGVTMGAGVTCSRGVRILRSKRGAPQIGARVSLFTGAIVIGEITFGEGSSAGALSIVIRNVPVDLTVFGAPARVISHKASKTQRAQLEY